MNLKDRLDNLPPEACSFCRRVSEIAFEQGCTIWITGGFVRDIILGRTSKDLDISVSSNGITFAAIVSSKLKVPVSTVYKKYGASVLSLENGLRCDIMTLRSETYASPAAVPDIVFVDSVKDDLRRRDFTINAMALSLNKSDFGELYDFYDGYSDLQNSLLKILHDKSFMDDPVRIFRALRFAVRMDLTLEPQTKIAMAAALSEGCLNLLSPSVLWRELESTFLLKAPNIVFDRMISWKIFDSLGWPALKAENLSTVGEKLQRIAMIVSRLKERISHLKVAKCTWLSFLTVTVLSAEGGATAFIASVSPPQHIAAYLSEVEKFSRRMGSFLAVSGGSSDFVSGCNTVTTLRTQTNQIGRPRKAEVVCATIAFVCATEADVSKIIDIY